MKYKNEVQIKLVPLMGKENKKFYKSLNNNYVKATVAALLTALVFVGGKVALDQFAGQLLSDKDKDNDEYDNENI